MGLPPALDHLGIAVRDLDAACAFYALLGIAAEGREVVAQEQVEVAMLPLAAGRIELLQPTGADSPVARFLERRGEGLHHVALRVPDLGAAVARLRAAGARLVREQPQIGAGGHRYVFVHPASAGGVLLELVEGSEEDAA
jgi:methylmalonyl-CoA epimerase